jgi:hypothetical protein
MPRLAVQTDPKTMSQRPLFHELLSKAAVPLSANSGPSSNVSFPLSKPES